MNQEELRHAARLLAHAWRSGELIERLPEACRPRDPAQAYAIELALLDELGETLAGWKVSPTFDQTPMSGLIVASRLFPSGAAIEGGRFSMRGVEIEIAFRCDRAFPPRDEAYAREEIARGVSALAGVEIVDTRFSSYDAAPALDRMADFLANGAYIAGPARADWRAFDLTQLEAYVAFDGRDQARCAGGHPAKDPLSPAVAFINHMRHTTGVGAGMFLTTGSYAGMSLAPACCEIAAGFFGFGEISCRLT